jgi:sugar-specific transcriptional regulator TrmB
MEFNELRELGLDENEIQVYLTCLRDKSATVKEIAKETGLIRTTIYGVLDSLTKKGLISKIKKEGVFEFQSASPKEILNILDTKKALIESILPKLKQLEEFSKEIKKIELFEGINGVKTVTNDIISKANETVKILGAVNNWISFSEIFSAIYYRKKKEQNVKTKTILTDNKEERLSVKNPDIKNSTFKFIKDVDLTKSSIFIYHDKVSFVEYEREKANGFIIQDKTYNKVMNEIFEKLWKQSKD